MNRVTPDQKHGKSSSSIRCHRKREMSHNGCEESMGGNRRQLKRSRKSSSVRFSRRKKQRKEEKRQHRGMSRNSDSICSSQEISSPQTQVTIPEINNECIEDENIDMEKEYMPHKWSTKFQTSDEVLQKYLNFITEESEIATHLIPNELDVEYSITFKGQKLDIFGTDLPDDAPILAFVHGGFWKELSKDVSRFPAASFHKAGVKTFIVGYGQRRKATLWDMIEHVEDAILYTLKYADEKKSRGVYLVGHCGGAHLIAKALGNYELLECRSNLNGVFLISGLYNLRDFSLKSAIDAVKLERIDEISLSPIYNDYAHLEHSRIRFYILAAEEDSPTFKRQARDFYSCLSDICPTENMYLEIKDGMDHYDIIKCLKNDDNYLKQLILHDLRKEVGTHKSTSATL